MISKRKMVNTGEKDKTSATSTMYTISNKIIKSDICISKYDVKLKTYMTVGPLFE